MSKIEDFENAPIGATATYPDGSKAVKMGDGEWGWVAPARFYYNDEEMVYWNYTLDPTAPESARGALDLAWELAYEVKPGQVIPAGTRFMEFYNSTLKEYIAYSDREIIYTLAPITRTLEPLSDTEPDWLDAPAVLAGFDGWSHDEREVFIPTDPHNHWTRVGSSLTSHWSDLRDVTPLYPKETQA